MRLASRKAWTGGGTTPDKDLLAEGGVGFGWVKDGRVWEREGWGACHSDSCVACVLFGCIYFAIVVLVIVIGLEAVVLSRLYIGNASTRPYEKRNRGGGIQDVCVKNK
jgi:hypothetical protein